MLCERQKPAAKGHALLKLAELGLIEFAFQLWLAHQDDLDELFLIGFQIGEQSELFEYFIAQSLGLIHQQSNGVSFLELLDQVTIQLVCQL